MSRISLKSLAKRKIVDTSTAETIGKVAGVVIDPSIQAVTHVVVKGGDGGVIPFADLINVGPDAITVSAASVVIQDDPDLPRAKDAFGTRLLDDAGTDLGTVDDLYMDDDGGIVAVQVGGTQHEQPLLGIGSYAVVIRRA